MSIQSQIDRINNAKSSLKSAISSKGVSVPSGASIDDLPALVRSIPQEGGSGGSGIIDVTELPTENIDESAVYRLTENIQLEKTEIYFVEGYGSYVQTVNEYFTYLGVPTIPNVYVVDDLSNMQVTDVQTFSAIHLYILRSNGVVYANIPSYGGTITCGLFGWQDLNHDHGFTENVYAETENGVYTTIEVLKEVVRYFARENGEWKEITAHIDTSLPHGTTDIEVLSGDYTKGEPIEITENNTEVNLFDMLVEEKNIPSSILVNVELPEVPNIAEYTSLLVTNNFYGYPNIPESFFFDTYGNVIGYIGSYAFAGSYGLAGVSIPDGVTTINDYAFYNCYTLTSVVLPDSVRNIYSCAFYGCSGLTYIKMPNNLVCIHAATFQNCCNLVQIILPDGITDINSYAFENCTALSLTSLPKGLTSIGSYAFSQCSELSLTSLPEGVVEIEEYAFQNCSKITLTSLPDGITQIPLGAFRGCTNLTQIPLHEGITQISSYAFEGCTNLSDVSIPESVTSLGNYTFYKCTGLTSVTLKSKCIASYDKTFAGCTNLTTINVPWSNGEVLGAPWGATNATINYNCTEG